MKKTCFNCVASVFDGGSYLPKYRCLLGYKFEVTNGRKISGGIYNTILTPQEECPKPLTWKQYDEAPLKKEKAMSYMRASQIEAFKDSTLEMVQDGKLVKVYKLTPPKRFHWCYIMFTPLGVVIGGDQRFGDRENGAAHSTPGMDEMGFLGLDFDDEEYLGSKFFGRKPSGRVALDRWANDVGWLCALQQEFRRLVELAGRS